MRFIFLIMAAYLIGSIPFAMIIARAYGKDLRKIGSGNIGATNLSRALGKKWGYVCFLLDTAKGLIPMLMASWLISSPPTTNELVMSMIVGCAAVAGHIFPVYIKFKGGKGVATSFGVAMGLWPYYTICALVALTCWAVCILIWRYVSLASIIAAIAFPIALTTLTIANKNWLFENLWPLFIVAIMIPLMVIIRHRENVVRIVKGQEHKVFSKKQQPV
jgi:glycerol-3-phosphate acyltransferase PlsY